MPLVFLVTNAGAATLTLLLLGRDPTADFEVRNARGQLLWSRLRGETMLGALRLFPLAGGKQLSFRHVWDQKSDAGKQVPLGVYLIRGVLLTDAPGGLASPPFRFRITP